MNTANIAELGVRQETATKPKPAAAKNTAAAQPLPKEEDRLTLSPEAKKKLAQQQEQSADAAKQMKEQLEVANAKAKAQAEVLDKAGKCMTIAGRIMAGDIVPQNDERFLAQNDSKLYMMAVSMRRQKEAPQKYRSITEKEDGGIPAAMSASGEVTESAEKPPATQGGDGGSTESGGEQPPEQ